ncbi:MAG: PorP/SprF family type IX secretion system membrane protein [Saprospiraceae bacterium]|nr:PorP/SprF family type IX secretion system membrane protein [Saprospiraceae bacterium]
MTPFIKRFLMAISCLLVLGFSKTSFAQDPVFSQYYAQSLHMNPGFTGLSFAPRFEMIYRNQWPLIDKSFAGYVTYGLSYDQFFKKLNSGFGIQLMADDAGGGLLKTIKVAGLYGYQAQISESNYLRGGIELAFVQTNYDWDRLVFGDQIDPVLGPISPGGTPYPTDEFRPDKTSVSYLDIGTGLLYYNPYFNLGVSAKHINTPQNDILKVNASSYNGIPVRWMFHGGMQLDLARSNRVVSILSPAFLVVKQSEFFQINLGAQYQFSTVFAGLWYRHARNNTDALIAVLGFKKGAWKMGYSFDFTLSQLGIAQGGSHELSLGLFLGEIRKEKANINDCFEAFR